MYLLGLFSKKIALFKILWKDKKKTFKNQQSTKNGAGVHLLGRITYEEPLQPSCLGKNIKQTKHTKQANTKKAGQGSN